MSPGLNSFRDPLAPLHWWVAKMCRCGIFTSTSFVPRNWTYLPTAGKLSAAAVHGPGPGSSIPRHQAGRSYFLTLGDTDLGEVMLLATRSPALACLFIGNLYLRYLINFGVKCVPKWAKSVLEWSKYEQNFVSRATKNKTVNGNKAEKRRCPQLSGEKLKFRICLQWRVSRQ